MAIIYTVYETSPVPEADIDLHEEKSVNKIIKLKIQFKTHIGEYW